MLGGLSKLTTAFLRAHQEARAGALSSGLFMWLVSCSVEFEWDSYNLQAVSMGSYFSDAGTEWVRGYVDALSWMASVEHVL